MRKEFDDLASTFAAADIDPTEVYCEYHLKDDTMEYAFFYFGIAR